jgi:hypothetical protein
MLHTVKEGAVVEDAVQGAGVVTMGINPTRPQLHLGHYLTMFNAVRAMKANPQALGVFFVDDREHHQRRDAIEGHQAFYLPSTKVVQRVEEKMSGFIMRIDAALGGRKVTQRTHVIPMSNYLSETSIASPERNSGAYYGLLFRNRERIKQVFEFDHEGAYEFVLPACLGCLNTPENPDTVTMRPDEILGPCDSRACDEPKASVLPYMGDTNWTTHYTVDPVRDALLSHQFRDRKVLHIFGGDYGIPWGYGRTPKAERMHTLLQEITPDTVSHFVGPIIMSDGKKMAKSAGHFSSEPELEQLLDLSAEGRDVIELSSGQRWPLSGHRSETSPSSMVGTLASRHTPMMPPEESA